MTKAKLLLLIALLSASPAGVYFVRASDGTVDRIAGVFGGIELFNKGDCAATPCNTPLCQQTEAIIADAGYSCTLHFAECPFRLGAAARAKATDAGVTFSAKKYQRAKFVAVKCGLAFGVPTTDAGFPLFQVTPSAPACVRAPLDGGLDCKQAAALLDGGSKYIGKGNVFRATQAIGTQCEPVECEVILGDNPNTDL